MTQFVMTGEEYSEQIPPPYHVVELPLMMQLVMLREEEEQEIPPPSPSLSPYVPLAELSLMLQLALIPQKPLGYQASQNLKVNKNK